MLLNLPRVLLATSEASNTQAAVLAERTSNHVDPSPKTSFGCGGVSEKGELYQKGVEKLSHITGIPPSRSLPPGVDSKWGPGFWSASLGFNRLYPKAPQ